MAGAGMFFQQWTGVNAILYYAPTIFQQLGMTGNTTSLLATGVVGIAMFLATIPAVIWIDRLGRRPVLISGAFVMAACHIIIAILTALYFDSWSSHIVAGWVAWPCLAVRYRLSPSRLPIGSPGHPGPTELCRCHTLTVSL
ncbi:hypothetical protein JB92DRAFT_2876746 [Gautieria morchelliformis]|nr:hypothetical protein JB92DRAFT_2876746 [Gautieria morchelliformis]